MPKEPTYYPLTAAQQINYVNQKYSLNKAIVDICTMMHFECELDEPLLLQAIYLGLMRNQSSNVRLHKVGKEVMQYISDAAPNPVIVMDYSDKTDEELERDLYLWSRTPFPNASMDTQLYSVRLIKKPNGFYGIYFNVSHLAFDAYCLMTVASDILKVYVALRDGLPIPKAKGNYLRLCETDWEYQKSEKKAKDIEYWKSVFETEPYLTHFDPTVGTRDKKNPRTGKLVDLLHSTGYCVDFTLGAEIVNRINETAMEMNISPQCFYLLAIRSVLSKTHDDVDDVSILNTVARRATLLQKRSGGTRVLGLPFRMNIDNKTTTIKEGLYKVFSLQAEYYSHADLLLTEIITDYFTEKFGKGPFNGYMAFNVTYNPYWITLPEGIKARIQFFSNGAQSSPCYLSIMALDDSGDLGFNYNCMDSLSTPDSAKNFHEGIVNALKAILDNPSMTLFDLNRV